MVDSWSPRGSTNRPIKPAVFFWPEIYNFWLPSGAQGIGCAQGAGCAQETSRAQGADRSPPLGLIIYTTYTLYKYDLLIKTNIFFFNNR